MTSPTHAPRVLFIHNGAPYDAHMQHLIQSGLRVSETHADTALGESVKSQPDLIVLDFGCDGDVTAQLKRDSRTKHIPIIALVELTRPA